MPTIEPDDSAPPALFDHCCNIYRAMLGESVRVIGSGKAEVPAVQTSSTTSDSGIIVYRGFLTKLVTDQLHLSVPYYTSAINRLKQMGCIRQLKRGGGTAMSEWELVYEPTLEAFLKAQPRKVPKQGKDEQTLELFDSLNKRISDLEQWQETVNALLMEKFGGEEA